jgi:hypothetical protein
MLLRRKVNSIRLIAAFHCAATTQFDLVNLENYDFVVTCTPYFLDKFSSHGLDTCLLYHAFEPRILEKITSSSLSNKNKFIFTGSLWLGQGWHNSRMHVLEQLANSGVDIDFFLSIRQDSLFKTGLKNISYRLFKFLQSLGATQFERNSRIKQLLALSAAPKYQSIPKGLGNRYKKPIFGLNMFEELASSLACINFHIDDADRFAGNIRLFEATGMGSCLITDWKENITDLFVINKEVITYRSDEECIDKLVWCAKNNDKARAIGVEGQIRTLSSHTTDIRAKVLNQWIEGRL